MQIRFYRWYGGKYRVTDEINALIPAYITEWYEACCGSAAVTLNKARHPVEVVNDLDKEIVNLFTLMADRHDGAILLERLLNIQHSRDTFLRAQRAQRNHYRGLDKFDMAEMSFVLITQSFNACRRSYANKVSQSDYQFLLKKNLPLVYERLNGVGVRCMDAGDLIDKVRDNPKAFVLLDVPYLPDLRSQNSLKVYGYEMSRREHIRLLQRIRDANCCIMLCGYRRGNGNDLYDKLLLPYGWKHYKLADLAKTCQIKHNKDVAKEWVWLNYEPPECAKYYINMDSVNW